MAVKNLKTVTLAISIPIYERYEKYRNILNLSSILEEGLVRAIGQLDELLDVDEHRELLWGLKGQKTKKQGRTKVVDAQS